jgi:hypothetical protein
MHEKRILVSIAGVLFAGFVIVAPACVGDSSTSDGGTDSSTCSKVCNDTCVSGNDPATGCGGTDCAACPTLAHQTSVCTAGACAAGTCATGFLDCDPKTPGCETPEDGNNCGKCGAKCGTTNTTAVSCGTSTASDAGAGDASAGDASADASSDAGTSTDLSCQFTCSGNFFHCSTDPSTGCETDLGLDKNNCGACGHSCQGGACASGTCQPLLIAGDPLTPLGIDPQYGITQLNGFVYAINWYASGGLVFKVPTDGSYGGKAPPWVYGAGINASGSGIFSNGTDFAFGIYRQDTGGPAPGIYAFTTSNNAVKNIVAGQGSLNTCPQNPGSSIVSVALDTNYVYWTNQQAPGAPPNVNPCPGIYRASAVDGTGRVQVLTTDQFTALLADGGSVYMLDRTDSTLRAALGSTLGTTSTLATFPTVGSTDPFGLAVDSTYAYVAHGTQKKVYRVKKVGGGTPQDITPSGGTLTENCAQGFIVDNAKIYCMSMKKIYSFNKDGSSTSETTMATIPNNDSTYGPLTQDATSIYWANAGLTSGTYTAVFKLAK